ncbi:hypothetical protein ACIBL6_41080 [Streptomyces sp. NPDC050400]|uniref:hypothetical protein n=1 Tax=Streptomyces sp. NPDC050400 TaxID=3365610 RepID=UPI003795EEE9
MQAVDYVGQEIKKGSHVVFYDGRKRSLRQAEVMGVEESQLLLKVDEAKPLVILEIPTPGRDNGFSCRYALVALAPVRKTIVVHARRRR